MNDADRFRLRFGPYRTPRVKRGHPVRCEVRGLVRVVCMTDAPIPWPVGRNGPGPGALEMFGALARAVRREAGIAVAFHWGVTSQLVSAWRKALDVGRMTPGSHELFSKHGKEQEHLGGPEAARAKARDPDRCRKIAEAHRGKRRGPHSEETRRKMIEAQKARADWGWTDEEVELLRTLQPDEVNRRTGWSTEAVYGRRSVFRRRGLELLAGRTRKGRRRGSGMLGGTS